MTKGFVVVLALVAGVVPSARAQEAGQPEGALPAGEHAEYILRTESFEALMEMRSVCPSESAWHRGVLERLLAPSQRTERTIRLLTIPIRGLLEKCEWAPAHRWLREALMEAPNYQEALGLIRGIDETWSIEDRQEVFLYVQRAAVSERARTHALRMAARHLEGPERVDFLFDVRRSSREADALVRARHRATSRPSTRSLLTEDYASIETSLLHLGETADAFASRGARSIASHPDPPGPSTAEVRRSIGRA